VIDSRSKETLPLRSFLLSKANLSRLTSSFLNLFLPHDPHNSLQQLFQKENKPQLLDYLASHHPLDILELYPEAKIPLQELVAQFGPLLPRFYSVASSPKMVPQEIHLTVGLTDFMHKGEKRYGVASHFLCNLAAINKTDVSFYVQSGQHFTLPDNPDAPIILIGPGTGIAPYRAFLQERLVLRHEGKNWLFFGERNKKTDFFYEEFWNELCAQKKLRLDLAFSRDQQEKIYVQHKMEEQASDLWAWIQEGAYLYVCGDATQMAKDVEASLIKIISEQGKMSLDDAKAYLKSLRAQKRYLLDVY
jgi:sulfite reductase (NADPH) flavoprotein alpha-component